MVVDMQKQKNFIITFVLVLVMLFTWNTAQGVDKDRKGTMQIDIIVNGEKHPFPIVSMKNCPHIVKIIMKDDDGQVTEEELESSCE